MGPCEKIILATAPRPSALRKRGRKNAGNSTEHGRLEPSRLGLIRPGLKSLFAKDLAFCREQHEQNSKQSAWFSGGARWRRGSECVALRHRISY